MGAGEAGLLGFRTLICVDTDLHSIRDVPHGDLATLGRQVKSILAIVNVVRRVDVDHAGLSVLPDTEVAGIRAADEPCDLTTIDEGRIAHHERRTHTTHVVAGRAGCPAPIRPGWHPCPQYRPHQHEP